MDGSCQQQAAAFICITGAISISFHRLGGSSLQQPWDTIIIIIQQDTTAGDLYYDSSISKVQKRIDGLWIKEWRLTMRIIN